MKNYYELLGIKQKAKEKVIEAAFWQIALTVHPDELGTKKNDAFLQVYKAYATLSDEYLRKLYDDLLNQNGATSSKPTTNPLEKAPWDEDETQDHSVLPYISRLKKIRQECISTTFILESTLFKDNQFLRTSLRDHLHEIRVELIKLQNLYARLLEIKKLTDTREYVTVRQQRWVDNVRKEQTLDAVLAMLKVQIAESCHWELPLCMLLLDLEFSHSSGFREQRFARKASKLTKEVLNNFELLPHTRHELLLLAVLTPEVESSLSLQQWQKIIAKKYDFPTEPECETSPPEYAPAKAKLAQAIADRFEWRYYDRLGRELQKRSLSPLKFLADRKKWISAERSKWDLFLLNTLYRAYVTTAFSDLKGIAAPIFDVKFQERVDQRLYDENSQAELFILREKMGVLWQNLSICARNCNTLSLIERRSLHQVATNLIQLFNNKYSEAEQLYHATCLLKTHAETLTQYHASTSYLYFLRFLTTPQLVTIYNNIVNPIAYIYWHGIEFKSIENFSLSSVPPLEPIASLPVTSTSNETGATSSKSEQSDDAAIIALNAPRRISTLQPMAHSHFTNPTNELHDLLVFERIRLQETVTTSRQSEESNNAAMAAVDALKNAISGKKGEDLLQHQKPIEQMVAVKHFILSEKATFIVGKRVSSIKEFCEALIALNASKQEAAAPANQLVR